MYDAEMEVCAYSSLQSLPLDLNVPPYVLERRGAISFGSTDSYVNITLPRFERRGAISFDDKDQNAIYVRMLGDVRMKVSPDQVKEKKKASSADSDEKLLEKLSSNDFKVKLSSRIRNQRRHNRQNVQRLGMSPKSQCLLDQQYDKLSEYFLTNVHNWEFNIFTLDLLTGGRPLFQVAFSLFQFYDLISKFHLDVTKLLQALTLMEDGYHGSNPYHNAIHAADVTQAMHCYLQEKKLCNSVPPFEVMTSLIAAMAHDMDHPGVNQAFLIATANHLAALYENTSVLEKHHWRFTMGILHESCVFQHLSKEQWKTLEWQIRSLILATDITRQQEFLLNFRKYLDSGEFDHVNNPDHRHFMLQIALKCADISNPCRPLPLSKQWSERVCDEFFLQGDKESSIHLQVTPMCNRKTMTVAKIQAGFFEFVVHPLFMEWHRFIPSDLSNEMLKNIDDNKIHWQKVMEEDQEKLAQTQNVEEEEEEDEECNEENQDDHEDERSDTVEETRLPLTFKHLIDEDDNLSYHDSRRGSCRSLSPVREISENNWDPEQRRHSMPPAYLRREITCVTIRRDALPVSQYLRRRSLPTAVIVHATSLDRLTGKLSPNRNTGDKSISMEELFSRPKLSNLTSSYETSLLASGLSVYKDFSHFKPQGNNVRFLTVPQTSKGHVESDEQSDKETADCSPISHSDSQTFQQQKSNARNTLNVNCDDTTEKGAPQMSFNCVDVLPATVHSTQASDSTSEPGIAGAPLQDNVSIAGNPHQHTTPVVKENSVP